MLIFDKCYICKEKTAIWYMREFDKLIFSCKHCNIEECHTYYSLNSLFTFDKNGCNVKLYRIT